MSQPETTRFRTQAPRCVWQQRASTTGEYQRLFADRHTHSTRAPHSPAAGASQSGGMERGCWCMEQTSSSMGAFTLLPLKDAPLFLCQSKPRHCSRKLGVLSQPLPEWLLLHVAAAHLAAPRALQAHPHTATAALLPAHPPPAYCARSPGPATRTPAYGKHPDYAHTALMHAHAVIMTKWG
jgi:hypothetical protein